jgi:putative oxidoreductase
MEGFAVVGTSVRKPFRPRLNRMNLCKTRATVSWILQIIASVILLQTLFFKFTAAPESVYIFKTLGLEPWGRIGTGIIELIASVLILTPRTVTIGAIIGLGVISGAIFSHLTKLGIVVMNDGGLLFGLALAVFGCCAVVLFIRRSEIPVAGAYFKTSEEARGAHESRQEA